jgi:hypothetical protein
VATLKDRMRGALRQVVVPALRTRGYRGSFPYFQREHDGDVELIFFDFWRKGDRVKVELRRAPDVEFNKLTRAQVITRFEPVLLQSPRAVRGTEDAPFPIFVWFEFDDGPGPYSPEAVADEILAVFARDGNGWWAMPSRQTAT